MESARCLFCYDAPCVQACPTHIDIPLFIKQIHTGNLDGAAKTIYESNWLGNACGKVCPTQVLCEGACVYNHQHVKPIEIGRLQQYATQHAIQAERKLFAPQPANGRRVAIVGAGPAGIACACELRSLGYSVDVFEAREHPSGLIAHGTAPYKITNTEALDEIEYLQKQFGFSIRYNHAIETREQLNDLETRYAAIFLGLGNGPTARLNLPGEDLENVIGAVEFVEALRFQKHRLQVPDRVVVLGGGNTAMDAASESARMGAAQIILAYRRSKADMGAYGFEYELAVSAGVQSLFNVSPLEILGEKTARAVRFVRTRQNLGKSEPVAGSEFEIPCDLVILATGQSKFGELLRTIPGIELDPAGRITANPDTFQTGNPKYFAGGDAVNGGAEVVNAAYEGKIAAQSMHEWLSS